MHKILLICLTSLSVVLNAAGQERADYVTAEQVQRDVTFLLLDKNIDDVMKQLETESVSTASLLRRLVIYGRSGQASRVRSTLRQLPSVGNWRCEVGYDLKWMIRSADSSF